MEQRILEITKNLNNIQLKELIKEATKTVESAKYSGIGSDKMLQLPHENNVFHLSK